MANDNSQLDSIRALIVKRMTEKKLNCKVVSEKIGKNPAYIHQYLYRNSPKRLTDNCVISQLAEILELEPQDLGYVPLDKPKVTEPVAPPLIPSEPNAEIPVFRDTEIIDRTTASAWTQSPTRGPTPASFAIWITEPRGRLETGDLAFVREHQPARIGNLVLVLDSKNRISRIGSLSRADKENWYITSDAEEAYAYPKVGYRVLKIASVEFA